MTVQASVMGVARVEAERWGQFLRRQSTRFDGGERQGNEELLGSF